jgi:hypothetical protein
MGLARLTDERYRLHSLMGQYRSPVAVQCRLPVDIAPSTCKHAIHEIYQPTLLDDYLVAPLTTRGPDEKM